MMMSPTNTATSRLIDKHLDNDNLLARKYLGELGDRQLKFHENA